MAQDTARKFKLVLLLTIATLSSPLLGDEILGTYPGLVSTAAGPVQVPCNLISSGPLRYPPKAKAVQISRTGDCEVWDRSERQCH